MFEENFKETLKTIFSKLGAGEISVSTDTRTIKFGDIFVAIKGEKFDGHDFVATAIKKGAAYCVVRDGFGFNVKEVDVGNRAEGVDVEKLIHVKDTVQALQEMAREYRVWLDQERINQGLVKLEVIGISGCNGKTTTKNFLASVLSQKFNSGAEGSEAIEKVAYTKGNLNNFIGLPLTILSLNLRHDFAVIELGSNHPGEITLLCDIAKPTYGITTSIGAAHIEFFKTLEAIADEEGAIAPTLPKNGLYVVPKQDQYSEYLLSKTSAQRIAVDAKHVECLGVDFLNIESKLGEIGINAPHIVMDALLVTVVAHKLGLNCEEIIKGLKETKNDKGRFSISEAKFVRIADETGVGVEVHITIIDDTYNGNPDSVIAAIKAMKELFPIQRKFVALGCLKELGEYTHRGYERIVDVCREYGIFNLILINIDDKFDTERDAEGVEMEDAQAMRMQIVRVIDNQTCAEYLKKTIEVNDVILCKGSHGARTWEVIEGLI